MGMGMGMGTGMAGKQNSPDKESQKWSSTPYLPACPRHSGQRHSLSINDQIPFLPILGNFVNIETVGRCW